MNFQKQPFMTLKTRKKSRLGKPHDLIGQTGGKNNESKAFLPQPIEGRNFHEHLKGMREKKKKHNPVHL
jgi:hypothetical protein